MHTVIYAIVPATDKKEALGEAKTVFERLTENQNPFDYYSMFNTEGSQVSGKGRWGNIPAALSCDTPAGKKMVEKAWKFQHDSFIESIQKIRKILDNFNDEEIFSGEMFKTAADIGETPTMFRYRCHCLGQYEGSDIWLYDSEGSGITDKSYLDTILKEKNMWIVPADVHF